MLRGFVRAMSDGNYVSDKTGVAGRVTMSGSEDVRDRNICARRKRGGRYCEAWAEIVWGNRDVPFSVPGMLRYPYR